MESRASYFTVGLLVSITFILSVFFIFWVSGIDTDSKFKYYTIYFKDHGLGGLQVGSAVTMRGIKVGGVNKFNLSSKNIEEVRVDIKVSDMTPVKVDTKAIIKRNILTGLATIELVGGTQGSKSLSGKEENGHYQVIKEGRTELDEIADSVPSLVEDAGEVLVRIKTVFSRENIEHINQTIKNIDTFSSSLNGSSKDFSELIENMNYLSRDLKNLSSSIKKTSETTSKSISILSKDSIKTLNQMTETLKQLEKDSKKISVATAGGIRRVVVDVSNVVEEITNAARSFTSTVEQFEDPRSLIVGPSEDELGPGERKER